MENKYDTFFISYDALFLRHPVCPLSRLQLRSFSCYGRNFTEYTHILSLSDINTEVQILSLCLQKTEMYIPTRILFGLTENPSTEGRNASNETIQHLCLYKVCIRKNFPRVFIFIFYLFYYPVMNISLRGIIIDHRTDT